MKAIILTGLLLGSFGIQAQDVVGEELAKNTDLRTERQKIFGIRRRSNDDEERQQKEDLRRKLTELSNGSRKFALE